MSELAEITPTTRQRLMDLVEAAGVDVSDWANVKGGKSNAAKNPKYCYEWAFVQPNKVVVLNLWHNLMAETNQGIVMQLNMRDFASKRSGPEKRRSLDMDRAIQVAIKDKLPIRVVVLGGRRRNINNPNERPSHVSQRLLDPAAWTVTAYDAKTGKCTLARGTHRFVDQFSIEQQSGLQPERRSVSGQAFVRSPFVRQSALLRAKGKCEWCGERGFKTATGGIFLETHHVVSLCDGGSDTECNVAALCPSHHREAHHGAKRDEMKQELLVRIRRKS